MDHSEGEFQGAGGLSLYYQRWRPAATPARAVIVLLHGDFAHSGWYMNLPTHEVPRGYAVYACDRRGWGRSPGQRGYIRSWNENLDDLGALLELVRAQEPDRPIFLMGHTGSAPIVLEYALRHPEGVQGVFCVSPVLDISPLAPALARRLIHGLARVWPRLTINLKRQFDAGAVFVSRDPEFVNFIRTDPLGSPKVTPRWFAEAENAMQRVRSQAASFSVPLLLLIGGADRNSSPQANKAFFQQVASAEKELREYPDAYTNLLSDTCYEEVLSDLDSWLDGHLQHSKHAS